MEINMWRSYKPVKIWNLVALTKTIKEVFLKRKYVTFWVWTRPELIKLKKFERLEQKRRMETFVDKNTEVGAQKHFKIWSFLAKKRILILMAKAMEEKRKKTWSL